MPTSIEHAKRVRTALFWFDAGEPNPKRCLAPLITEYFYASLHMFESVIFDFPDLSLNRQTHFVEHSSRNLFLNDLEANRFHEMNGMARPYQALYGLSRRARYLQESNRSPVFPVRFADLSDAVARFEDIRLVIEDVYSSRGQLCPWL